MGRAVRGAALVLVVAVSVATGLPAGRLHAAGAATAPPPSVSINPTSGTVGTMITFTPFSFSVGCLSLVYGWNGTITLGSGGRTTAFSAPAPNAANGTYPISVTCTMVTGLVQKAGTRFTITGPAPTTTTTRPSTTTTTTAPSTTTTTPGQTTTTRSGDTTTTAPGDTTSTSTDATDTTDTTDTTTSTPDSVPGSTSSRPGSSLKFDALAIAPGSTVSAIGKGCDADAPVDVTIDSATVARTSADDDGSFHTALAVSSLDVGRYDVTATCGPVLTAPLDIVLASAVDEGTSTTMVIIVFFVLLGLLAFRRQLFPSSPRSTGPGSSGSSDSSGEESTT